MPLTEGIADSAAERYLREYDRYVKLADYVWKECEELVAKAGISATVQHRAKAPGSFRAKLQRYIDQADKDKVNAINRVDDVFKHIGDLAGVRIATYVETDRDRVVEKVRTHFRGVPDHGNQVHVDRKDPFRNGYRGTHCQVRLPPYLEGTPDVANIWDTSCEIQVCSMLAHAWNEIEHDIRYKNVQLVKPSDMENTYLDRLLRETGAGMKTIESLLRERSSLVAAELEKPLAALFPQIVHFSETSMSAIQEFVRLGYDSVDRIKSEFLVDDYVAAGFEAVAIINRELEDADEATRLNPGTADLLLALLIRRHTTDLAALHEHDDESDTEYKTVRIAAATMKAAGA